jgi:hypothetical protein
MHINMDSGMYRGVTPADISAKAAGQAPDAAITHQRAEVVLTIRRDESRRHATA